MANIQTHAGPRQRMQKMILGNKIDIEERAVRNVYAPCARTRRVEAPPLGHRVATDLPPFCLPPLCRRGLCSCSFAVAVYVVTALPTRSILPPLCHRLATVFFCRRFATVLPPFSPPRCHRFATTLPPFCHRFRHRFTGAFCVVPLCFACLCLAQRRRGSRSAGREPPQRNGPQ